MKWVSHSVFIAQEVSACPTASPQRLTGGIRRASPRRSVETIKSSPMRDDDGLFPKHGLS